MDTERQEPLVAGLVAVGDVTVGAVQYKDGEPLEGVTASSARWLMDRGAAKMAADVGGVSEDAAEAQPTEAPEHDQAQPLNQGNVRRSRG